MQYAIVDYKKALQYSQSWRIDAEYYQIQPLIDKISSLDSKKLSNLSKWITQGPNPKFTEEGIPCLTGRNIADGEVNFFNSDQVDEEEYQSLIRFKLIDNDILITLKGSGSTGKLALFNSAEKAIFSRNLGLIRLSSTEVTPELIFAFFSSKTGQKIIDRGVTGGTGQLTLPTSYLKQLSIPLFDKQLVTAITSIVRKYINLHNEAENLYKEAETILLTELGFEHWKPTHQSTFIKKFSETKSVERIDAEYFQPKYDEIVERIQAYKHGAKTLEKLTKLVGHPANPAYEKVSYENKTFIITQKHLGDYFPIDDFWEDEEALYTTDEFITKNQQFILQKNDIILYSVGAYIGKANLYNSNTKATIGSFLTLIRPIQELINPHYLLVFLNSKIGQLLTRRNSRGLAQQYIYPYDTRKTFIPLLESSIQSNIESVITKGQEYRNLSKELLYLAKEVIEVAIKTNNEEAFNMLTNNLERLHVEV